MLLEYSVKNFRSIKDSVTLSLIPSSIKGLQKNIIKVSLPKNTKEEKIQEVLNKAVVYGANSSGKSNVLLGLDYMKLLIETSHKNQIGNKFPKVQYKLDEKYLDLPTEFDVKFIKENILYNYILHVTPERVVSECLYYAPNGTMVSVIERNEQGIKLMPGQSKISKEDKIRRKIYSEDIAQNMLILSKANDIKIEPIQKCFEWFVNDLSLINKRTGISSHTTPLIQNDVIHKDEFIKYFKLADNTIQNFSLVEKEIQEVNLPCDLKEMLIKKIAKENNIDTKDICTSNFSAKRIDEYTYKQGIDREGNPKEIRFRILEESDGTQKYYGILGDVLTTLNKGGVLIVDELDMRLHPNLLKAIIAMFSSPHNKKNAQLICSVHDTHLLDSQEILRRDQIWFTDKSSEGVTDLYSLYDFKLRSDKKIERSYIEGVFGAIPYMNLEDIICN